MKGVCHRVWKVMPTLPLIVLMLAIGQAAYAGENDVVDGDTGVLYVSGTLARSACNVDSDTLQQSVNLGTLSSGELINPGERGAGRAFHLKLRDCFDPEAVSQPDHNGNSAIGDGLPFVRVNFMSAADSDNHALIAVYGAQGFGLRLEDDRHRAVLLNQQAEPLRVTNGDSVLTYYLLPERTHASLKEGAWQAVIYIGMSYD
ncbi:fimbrial protein [Pantoea agglomerans]|uniref:fimbrial protein n=1 Tax=Enterobacter agglomerans TaxID=549 RepID=UPI003D29B951